MHPNHAFRQEQPDRHRRFAAEVGFGVLCVPFEGDVMLSHIPFHFDPEADHIDLHLARGNPIVRTRAEHLTATLAVQGPHGYVSPDWYQTVDQVPTWNYVAVHIKGTLVRQEQSALRPIVDELSEAFETRISTKTPWTSDKVSADAMDKLMIQIVPFRFDIKAVEGTWKLNQNKPDSARRAAADALEASSIGQDTPALAALMRGLDEASG